MRRFGWKWLPIALTGVVALASASAGASFSSARPAASAKAFAVKVLVPGSSGGETAEAIAPPDAAALDESFAYPADGSIVSTGPLSATASTSSGVKRAGARAATSVTSLQLFGGEISVAKLSVQGTASAGPRTSAGRLTAPGGITLSVLGQQVTAIPNLKIQLADWGYIVLLEQQVYPSVPTGLHSYHGSVSALDVRLTAEHGGLPVGSQILIGYAEAGAQAKAQAAPPPVQRKHKQPKRTQHKPTHPAHRRQSPPASQPPAPAPKLKPQEPKLSPFGPPPVQPPPKRVSPKLTAGGYVFPVYGPSSFSDTFGAARADVGWHHGDDIFAPLGAPILAVANGTVFSVGWNDLGGNRLWLADRQGNQFYYAHLSAFSPLAVNGARVKAGDVLGFVGNTGDAIATPYHLHFEIHPVSMLGMGYDGVIDPTSYLMAWQHLRDLGFPSGSSTTAAQTAVRPSAPQPGMFLLNHVDISSASSLTPASIRKALSGGYSGDVESDSVLVGVPRALQGASSNR